MNIPLQPRYITDETGKKMSVVLSIEEYESLIEEIEDLAIVAERKDEETTSYEEAESRWPLIGSYGTEDRKMFTNPLKQ